MENDHRQRRLSAILAADVAGYTRLVEQDTDATVSAWQDARAKVIDPLISTHSGRIVKHTGDGFLAEFPTVQDGVACAIGMQEGLADSPLQFRMGINLGDIIDDGEDIHGEGVNIAARLEGLSEPGGVCVSAGVFDQVRNRLNCRFEDLGEHDVKHVSAPIRVYRIVMDRTRHEAETKLDVPEKPSIAVLPFDNMSGDPEQEYFVDGVVEDILTTLSKIHHLFVIARNSSFVYKGKSVDIRTVGAELGVRYVLEGGVRKAGNRVRLSAQLIDCRNGHHVWAERYDGLLDDVFELQDRITQEIVTALEIELTEGEQVRIWRQRTGNPQVYEHFHKGRVLYMRFSKDANRQAKTEVEQALSIHSDYTPALTLKGYILADSARFGWVDDVEAAWSQSIDCANRVIEIEPGLGEGYAHLGYANLFQDEFDLALANVQKAVELSPNSADVCHMAGMIQIFCGNPQTGIGLEQQSLRLNPLVPTNSQVELGRAYYHAGNYAEARNVLRLVVERRPRWLTARSLLVAALSRMGAAEEAEEQAAEILGINPHFSPEIWASRLPYRNSDDLEAVMEPLQIIVQRANELGER